MGQKLCCFGNPNPKETSSLSEDVFLGVESTIMTLEDYLILSPALNPQQCEISVLKQPNKRVYPSSPEFDFYTPTVSFSLEKIDEEEGSRKPIMSRSRRPSLKKKVSFKLPEEAVVIFYSPDQTSDPMSDASSL